MKPTRGVVRAVAFAVFLVAAGGLAFAQDGNHEGPKGPIWMPPGTSTTAPEVDGLWTFIFWVTGITFVGVEGLLLLFCVMYRRKPGGKTGYTHGSNFAETIWTIIPAIMLLIIAVVQLPAWRRAKMEFPKDGDPDVVKIQVMAKQFQFNFRYQGPDGKFNTYEELKAGKYDDVLSDRMFQIPIGKKIWMPLRSLDVIHSFFIFNMRVKQDTVPGLRNQVWFQPTGFYVVELDKKGRPFNKDWQQDFKPEPNREKWLWVDSEEAFQKRFGADPVGVDPWFVYEGGQFRVFSWEKPVTLIQNNKVRRGPAGDAKYCIVPYEVACAELCGEGHYTMKTNMFVVPKAAFEAWLEAKAPEEDTPPDDLTLNMWKHWKD